ncbi:MAG: DUF805 domain-containing protein [Eubacteriales bacterium]
MNEYVAFWKNYVNFSDRTTRKGFWMAYLLNVIVASVVITIAYALDMTFLTGIYSAAIMIPMLAILVRRLNDMGKDWKWIFIQFVPCIGSIWLLILCIKPSAPDNGVPTV